MHISFMHRSQEQLHFEGLTLLVHWHGLPSAEHYSVSVGAAHAFDG